MATSLPGARCSGSGTKACYIVPVDSAHVALDMIYKYICMHMGRQDLALLGGWLEQSLGMLHYNAAASRRIPPLTTEYQCPRLSLLIINLVQQQDRPDSCCFTPFYFVQSVGLHGAHKFTWSAVTDSRSPKDLAENQATRSRAHQTSHITCTSQRTPLPLIPSAASSPFFSE
jgi:hypothetical protein